MIDDFIHQVRKALDHDIQRQEKANARGKNISDFADYRQKVGELRGLERALQAFNYVVQRHGIEEETDDG